MLENPLWVLFGCWGIPVLVSFGLGYVVGSRYLKISWGRNILEE